MTLDQLKKFIKKRNASSHQNNLQFMIDARECGVNINELGEAKPTKTGYCWDTPYGRLMEVNGKLQLNEAD